MTLDQQHHTQAREMARELYRTARPLDLTDDRSWAALDRVDQVLRAIAYPYVSAAPVPYRDLSTG